jgi:hypothetical protein
LRFFALVLRALPQLTETITQQIEERVRIEAEADWKKKRDS